MAKKLAFERYYRFIGQIKAGRYPIGASVEAISPEEPGEEIAEEMGTVKTYAGFQSPKLKR